MKNTLRNIYVLSGTRAVINLYLKSIEALTDDENHDFMVYKIDKYCFQDGHNKEITEMTKWEISIIINEQDYYKLYSNLCQKLRLLVNKKLC